MSVGEAFLLWPIRDEKSHPEKLIEFFESIVGSHLFVAAEFDFLSYYKRTTEDESASTENLAKLFDASNFVLEFQGKKITGDAKRPMEGFLGIVSCPDEKNEAAFFHLPARRDSEEFLRKLEENHLSHMDFCFLLMDAFGSKHLVAGDVNWRKYQRLKEKAPKEIDTVVTHAGLPESSIKFLNRLQGTFDQKSTSTTTLYY